MVSSEGNGRADVWSAEASLNCEDVDAPVDEGDEDEDDAAELFAVIMDAVAIDSRERTRSSGYVVPAIRGKERVKQNKTQSHAGKSDRTNRQK